MAATDRMRMMRELRLMVPDPRSQAMRERIAHTVARLDLADEADALRWIEAVSEFDSPSGDTEP